MDAFRRLSAVFLLALCLPGLLLSCFVIHCNIRRTVEGAVSFDLGYRAAGGFPLLTDADGELLWRPGAGWEQATTLADAPTHLILWIYGRISHLLADNE
ncbi:MAG: hypothetical protein E7541_00920 [Ruminococcaceae bacterium]|nr:hypothetical protein [Oscillospiraceae bacterium]